MHHRMRSEPQPMPAKLLPLRTEQIAVTARITEVGCQVRITGELDLATAPDLLRALDELLDSRPPYVAVDISGLSFIDCAGFHALVTAGHRYSAAGGRLTVIRPSAWTLRIMHVLRLDTALHVGLPEASGPTAQRAVPGCASGASETAG